jgi:hypothetical protein
MANENNLKAIPYAVSNFKEFSESNYYFSNKTRLFGTLKKRPRSFFSRKKPLYKDKGTCNFKY